MEGISTLVMGDLFNLKFILAPLLVHVVLAAILRLWLFPYVADRCVWLSTYITSACINWFLFGSAFVTGDVLELLPTLVWRVGLFIQIQWFLLVYYVLTSFFVHKKSDTGWLLARKFVPLCMLLICHQYNGSAVDTSLMLLTGVYLIIHFSVVDIGIDFYYLVKSLKDMAAIRGSTEVPGPIYWILLILYPALIVSWIFAVILPTYDWITHFNINPLFGYTLLFMQLAIQVFVLFPIKFR